MAHIVLVEPFYGGSHRSWADGWRGSSRHRIELVTHPGEFWRWRLRGGAVTLARAFADYVEAHGRPDAVVVSGLVDVAAFAGHARRSLCGCPIATYMHESQLLYPLAPNQRPDTSAALANWQSLVVADQVWFNSEFHRTALKTALPSLLEAQPEPNHLGLLPEVFARSTVLWPGVSSEALVAGERHERSVPRVLWNQRWDHDKNPGVVFEALAALAEDGVPFTVSLAGENPVGKRQELEPVLARLHDRIDHQGFLEIDEYRELLLASDVVVSAADHEFFGIAIVEAIAGGAVPVVPNRLSFPELIEPRWHRTCLYEDGGLHGALRETLTNLAVKQDATHGLRASMLKFDVAASAAAHDDAVDRLLDST